MIELISLLVDGLMIYLLFGILFSIWFVWRGAQIIDKGVAGTPFHFKLILIPGAVLLWTALLYKILKK